MAMVMAMHPVDRSSDRPAYKQVADGLRERLDAGEFGTDGQLPSETVLMRECDVSRATARRGLSVLIAEGRAEAIRGRGVFAKAQAQPRRLIVKDPASILQSDVNPMGPMAVHAESQGFGYDYHGIPGALAVHEVSASPRVASLLGVDVGSVVLARERLVHFRLPDSTDWRPAKIANSYLPLDVVAVVPTVKQLDTGKGGMYGALASSEFAPTHYDETVLVRMPTPRELRRLQITTGQPVIEQTRVAFRHGRPVECFLAVMAGDIHELEYRIDATASPETRVTDLPPWQDSNRTDNTAAGDLNSVPVAVDPIDDRPLYKQIADWVRNAIERGVLLPDMRLPSETALMRRFHTTRTTVRRALSELANEGRVRAERGVGVFVKPQVRDDAFIREPYDRMARHRRQQGQSPMYADAATQGLEPGDVAQDRVELAEVTAPADVATWLEAGVGASVFRRRRRMRMKGVPTQLTTTYLPLDIAVGDLRQEKTGDGGTHARIEELGYKLTEFVERLSVRMPNDEEMRELRLGAGAPVVDLVQITYAQTDDGRQRPVECFTSVIAGDRYVFRYRVHAH